jgi:hypothetical protein
MNLNLKVFSQLCLRKIGNDYFFQKKEIF